MIAAWFALPAVASASFSGTRWLPSTTELMGTLWCSLSRFGMMKLRIKVPILPVSASRASTLI